MADVERLITLLNNPDKEVRVRAIIALGQVRDSHAAEPLIAILRQESDWEVCKHAVKAVGGTGDLRAFKPLIAMLRNPNMANTPRQINRQSHCQCRFPGACRLADSGGIPRDDSRMDWWGLPPADCGA